MQTGREIFGAKIKLNTIVTASHIVITLAYTLTQVLIIFSKNKIQYNRMFSAYLFFGGLAEIFLSIMLWFILESKPSHTFIVDGERVYSVAQVLTGRISGINFDCNAENENDRENSVRESQVSSSTLGVSRRMIEQFFTEVEGPDRDWQQELDNGMLLYEDRAELTLGC